MELPTREDLKERRDELDLTQTELAEMADVSQPLIARIEGGDVDPRLSTLRRIVNALDEAAGDVIRVDDVMHESVISVAPDDAVEKARDVMFEEGYSQLPVIREGSPRGIISNTDIRRESETRDAPVSELPVADVMHESISTIEPETPIDQVDSYLDHHRAVLVVDGGQVVGIITEADIAAHVS